MKARHERRADARARTVRAVVAAVSLLAVASAADGKSFPTHPFVPGSLVIAETT
jgi:hypothetical protein